jgi:hypothetical protein
LVTIVQALGDCQMYQRVGGLSRTWSFTVAIGELRDLVLCPLVSMLTGCSAVYLPIGGGGCVSLVIQKISP